MASLLPLAATAPVTHQEIRRAASLLHLWRRVSWQLLPPVRSVSQDRALFVQKCPVALSRRLGSGQPRHVSHPSRPAAASRLYDSRLYLGYADGIFPSVQTALPAHGTMDLSPVGRQSEGHQLPCRAPRTYRREIWRTRRGRI